MDKPNRPTGTITFLFTDIEGSTELAAMLGPETYRLILEKHQRLLRDAFAAHDGIEQSTEGDSFFVVFRDAPSAVGAAVLGQRSLAAEQWPERAQVRVRMGMHTGQGVAGGDDYVGIDVNRAARIAAAGHGGQVLLSDATRSLSERELPDGVQLRDVGEHRLKGLRGVEHLYQLIVAGLAADFPPVRSLNPPANLPMRTSSFIGREQEADDLETMLDGAQLVTLVGPGGTGKTSLATEVARRAAGQFADGAWFVPLDSISDPQLVGSAIVAALGLRDISGRSAREQLFDNLPGRSLLLVLDNFEQVIDAATLISDLLVAAPGVKAIVTSRAPLRLGAEHAFPVAPLAIPDPGADTARLSVTPSVKLFIDRARSRQPDFSLTPTNADIVAEICRRLDGLPLAIELAAARVQMLGPAGVLERLVAQAALGGPAARDAPARQRTLEDTIAWSHELLDLPSRNLFARLAVFSGGWLLEQAERVCQPRGEGTNGVEDELSGLVEQSLITTIGDGDGVRFGMLQTIRQYAAARLEDSGMGSEVRRRHALEYLGLAESAGSKLESREAVTQLNRLQRERENLRAAVRYAIDANDVDIAVRFAGALGRYWGLSGQMREGAATLRQILDMPGADAPTVSRVRALEAAGNLAYYTGDVDRPRAMYRAQLDLARAIGDDKGVADARYNRFFTEFGPGDAETALAELDEIAAAYGLLGDELRAARTMWARATVLMTSGRVAEAYEVLEQAIVRYRDFGDLAYETQTAGMLGDASFRLGQPSNAARWMLEGVTAAHRGGNVPMVTAGLPSIAMAAFHLGQAESAATLLGAYDGLSRRYGIRMPENLARYLEDHDPPAQVREALDKDEFDKAHANGAEMTIDEVMDHIVQLAEGGRAAPPES